MPKIYFSPLIFLALFPSWICAEESERKSEAWVGDFFQQGIQSAYAEFNLRIPSSGEVSASYYKRKSYSIEYNAKTLTYAMRFTYEHRDDWSILTDNGNHPPPTEQVFYNGSKINVWTNSNGLGTYSEVYQRNVPNWLIFNSLDSLLMMQSKMGNPLPPLTGIFHEDELKTLKKVYKEQESSGQVNELLSCFEFDNAGNLLEFSKAYLDEFKEENLRLKKPVDDYSIVIRNTADDVVFIKPILHISSVQIIEGVGLKSGDKRAKIFSFELNQMLHRFIPMIYADPKSLIENYLQELQKASEKPFARFETSVD